MYTRVSLSELVPLSRPPLCDSLSERTPYRNVLLIGTICNVLVIGTALCDSLSERTPYRNKTNCSDKEYSWPYSLSEQIVQKKGPSLRGLNLSRFQTYCIEIDIFDSITHLD